MKGKILTYIGAWLAALFATDPSLGLWALAWMFPLGLYAFFFPEHRQQAGWTVMIVVTLIYVAHGILYFRARTTRSTVILGLILIALLVCNVDGCRAMVHAH